MMMRVERKSQIQTSGAQRRVELIGAANRGECMCVRASV
jgi:hypothetical protein